MSPLDSGREALAHFATHKFCRLPREIRMLGGIKTKDKRPILPRGALLVLLALVEHANWQPKRQHGIAGTWVSTRCLAQQAGVSENTAADALHRLGNGHYRERRQGGAGTIERRGLGIIREATPDEKAGITEDQPGVAGRPPKVWVFRHPDAWNLPEHVRAELERLRARVPIGRGGEAR